MAETKETEKTVYLYKATDDKITVKKGTIRTVGDCGAVFYASNESGKGKNRYVVSATAGEVYNGTVWLSEPDEEAVARAFVRWADAKMDEHVAKLKKLGEFVYNMKSYIKPY